jgi:hypothetical protein
MIGYYGFPDPDDIAMIRQRYEGPFIDLDIDYGKMDPDYLSRSSCRIVRNIIANAIEMKGQLDLVIASVGPEKCDGGRYAAHILQREGIAVLESQNLRRRKCPLKLSVAKMPLREKVERIMNSIIESDETIAEPCVPTCGFWGVPPNDLRVLDVFPETTHVFGWTRCVEAGVPSDLNYEMEVPSDLPIIFFAQSFCSKSNLGRLLAEQNRGLYIDCDDRATRSVLARIEAFLALG